MKRKGLLQFNILAKAKVAVVLLVVEILMLFSGLTACGDTAEEVPELMEPTSLAESYRTVTKRVVGRVKYHKFSNGVRYSSPTNMIGKPEIFSESNNGTKF